MVNTAADYFIVRRDIPGVATIGDRLDEICKARGMSHRALAVKAGLRSTTHVGTLIESFASDPNYTVKLRTLEQLAKAGGVSLWWLISGQGTRDVEDLAPDLKDDPYPNRARAIQWARDQVSAAAVAHVQKLVFEDDDDQPPVYWAAELWHAHLRLQARGSAPVRIDQQPRRKRG